MYRFLRGGGGGANQGYQNMPNMHVMYYIVFGDPYSVWLGLRFLRLHDGQET